jgi:hypothetical protein
MQGGVVTVGSFFKSVGQGAVVGSITGASSHAVNGSAGVVRVIAQGATAAATDAGIQYHETGEVDLKQTAVMAVGLLTVSTTTEVASNMVQKSSAYVNKVNDENISKDVRSGRLTEAEGAKLKQIMKDINNEIPSNLKSQKRIGEYQAHKLYDRANAKRGDQIAFNTDGKNMPARGLAEKHNDKYVYLDKTADHNYKECRDTLKGKLSDPIESLKATKVASLVKQAENGNNDELKPNFSYYNYIRDYFKSKL